jgi:hypothetical protein
MPPGLLPESRVLIRVAAAIKAIKIKTSLRIIPPGKIFFMFMYA